MAQIENIITTVFKVRDSQAIAAMGGIGRAARGMGGSIAESTRMSERFGQQWRAIGTTIRYALAGGVVFGLRGMVDQLRQVQVQMGLISAIGSTPSGGSIVGASLSKLMDQSRAGAIQSITPLTDYNNAVLNLLSSVQNVPQDQITPLVTTIAQSARLAQISAEDATKAFTTMNIAFGRPVNLSNVHKMAQEFFILTQQAPGGVAAGQQVVGQLGQLAQVTRAAHGTPEDMFSLLLTTLRTGIPPAQAGRGLQYLIQTLAFPGQGTKQSRQALGAVGITTTSNLPLQERLSRIFSHARKLGIHGDMQRIIGLDENTLSDFEATGDTTGSLNSLGVSGRGTEYLGQVFHRIHALRTALAIQGQINVGQAGKDLQTITDASNGHVSDVNDLGKAWQRFRKQAKLQEATVALNTMTLQVANAFAPVLNWVAGRTTGFAESAHRHPRRTRDIALGAAGLGALLGLKGFLGVGSIIRGGVGIKAAEALATGGGGKTVMDGLGNSPANALYVVVVNPQFFGGRGVTGGGVEPPVQKALRRFPWLAPIGVTAGAAAGVYASERMRQALESRHSRGIPTHGDFPELQGFAAHNQGGLSLPEHHRTAAQQQILGAFSHGFISAQTAETRLENLKKLQDIMKRWSPRSHGEITRIFGSEGMQRVGNRMYATFDVNLKFPDGSSQHKKIHVPVDIWSGGRAPSSRAQPGNSRSR